MHGRLHDRIQKKEALAINPILDDDEFYAEIFTKGATETRFHDPLKSALYRQQFDLYGGSFRLLELPERERALTNVVLRERQVEIQNLSD